MHLRTKQSSYYVYIVANKDRKKLEVGSTGDLNGLLLTLEYESVRQNAEDKKSFCNTLLYWENYDDVLSAVTRKDELIKLSRRRTESLIQNQNPEWKSLNDEVLKGNHDITIKEY